MNSSMNFVIDVMMLVIGMHFIAYMLYGRLRRRPLVGDYKPGDHGYAAFLRFVNNNKYLASAVALTAFFALTTLLDVRRILDASSSSSILIWVPVLVVASLFVMLYIMSSLLGKKR